MNSLIGENSSILADRSVSAYTTGSQLFVRPLIASWLLTHAKSRINPLARLMLPVLETAPTSTDCPLHQQSTKSRSRCGLAAARWPLYVHELLQAHLPDCCALNLAEIRLMPNMQPTWRGRLEILPLINSTMSLLTSSVFALLEVVPLARACWWALIVGLCLPR